MNLNKILKDKTIIICSDSYKNYFLKEMTKSHLLLDVKFFTKNEFINEYLFKFEENALYYLIKKYHFKVEVASMYLNNLLYINNQNYQSKKLQFLKKIKDELEENNLIKYNLEFKNYIKDYQIIIVGYPYLDNNEIEIFNELKAKYITHDNNYLHNKVYVFKTIDDEINATLKEICNLINKGININKIKLLNIDEDYYIKLSRYAKFYNLPIKKLEKTSLYSTYIAKIFLDNLKNGLNNAYEKIKDMNEDIVNKIITICNKYTFVKEYNNLKQLLIYEFKNTNITKNELENYVDNLTIEDYISDDSYVFMLNFNTSSIPKIIKDEEYIDDLIKKEVNLKTTVEKNILFKEFTKNKIKNIKNLWISYKLNSEKNEYYPSTLIKELNLKEEEYKNDILNSNSIINDKINYAKSLYNFETYGINDNLDIYINTLGNIKYNSYNNKFKGIDIKDLKEYLNYKLNLSYSSLNNYHKCSFRYYLANILNIDKYEDTFEGYLGSLFHDVLEKCLINNLDIDTEINNYINKSERILDNKEKFFINKIKEDIIFARDIIIKQNEDISLDQNYFEKLININKNQDDMEINFKGFIDKILYKTIDDKTYISIIDYKTGNVSADLKYLPYGFNMQLPIYLYLVKKSNLFVNPEIVGFYLQFILNNNLLRNNNKIEEIKKDNLKLVGYSIDNISSLVLFDKNYENSNIIKGLKVKNDGTFYKTAKVLSNDQIENIINTTEKIIDNDIKNILKGEFNINPKKIGYDKEIGCEFCHFKDICYKKNTDEIILEDIGGQDE